MTSEVNAWFNNDTTSEEESIATTMKDEEESIASTRKDEEESNDEYFFSGGRESVMCLGITNILITCLTNLLTTLENRH